VGDYAADLLVEEKIIVELKTDTAYQSIHECQLLNELRGTGIRAWVSYQFWPRARRIQTDGLLIQICVSSVPICGKIIF